MDRIKIPLYFLFSLITLGLLTACDSAPRLTEITAGQWRLSIQLPGGELPLTMELRDGSNGMQAFMINGPERVQVPLVNASATAIELEFPAFNNRLSLAIDGDHLAGKLQLVKRGYTQAMAVTAYPQLQHRFIEEPMPQVDITGRWEVVFTDAEGNQTQAVGEFDQLDGEISGTFLTATGDYRYLAGNVHGNEVRLSTFDGAHAFLFTAAVAADGRLNGDFWSGTKWHETWTGVRNFDASLPDAYEATRLTVAADGIAFSFPNLDGVEVSLEDSRFQDKVVLLGLAGTWCPNCADEAEFLAPYYEANKDRGLEIVGLLFEHFDDFDSASRQGRAWKQKHGINYELLIAGISDKAEASKQLPFLDRVRAYPTLIFIGRDGTVRKIHTGFMGPGTGQHYQAFKTEFNQLLDALLAE